MSSVPEMTLWVNRAEERSSATVAAYLMPDGGETKALDSASRRRRRLPGDALIPVSKGHEVGLGLAEEVSVRRRLGRLVPGGRSAGGRDRGWPVRLTESQGDLLDGRGLGDVAR